MIEDLDFDLDMGAFDLDLDLELDLDDKKQSSRVTENRYCLPKLYRPVKVSAVKYDNAEKLANDVGDKVLGGETVQALLSGNFIFGDFIEALAVTQNIFIDEIQLSTLSFSEENVESFRNLFDGDYLGRLDIIVSDYFWSHNRHNAPYIFERLDIDDRFQLAVAGTHTRITLIRVGDKKIVISGSANLRSSRCVEEIKIETNPELFDFHYEWQSKILEEYGTIKKSIRAGKLFHLFTKDSEDKKTWLQK